MPKYYAQEMITGVASTDVQGAGITSNESERKKLVAVHLTCSAKQDNQLRLWHNREKILEFPTQSIPLETYAYHLRLEVDHEIPFGDTILASVNSGGSACDVNVAYEYEVN